MLDTVVPYVGLTIFESALGSFLIFILIVLTLTIHAPIIAMKVIRRNRCLGGNIYCGIAQADRFMEVWMMRKWSSVPAQYRDAFITNGNSAAGHVDRIDLELEKLKLVDVVKESDGRVFACAKRGNYWLRNWIVFLLVLFVRVTFFGDKYSHIRIADHFSEQLLQRLYWLTVASFLLLVCTVLVAISYYF